jgi:hypothetical protein
MEPVLEEKLRAAEEAVSRLIECCRKNGPLHTSPVRASPKSSPARASGSSPP